MRQLGPILCVFSLLAAVSAQAAPSSGSNPTAGTLQRLNDVLRQAPMPTAIPPVLVPMLPALASPTANQLREDTRLTLTAIDLRGVTQLKPEQIAPLFETLNGQETSLAELDKAVAALTNLYQQQGYILSRAYLPEQEIRDGVVIIQALEGKIEEVVLNANERVSENPLVRQLLNRVKRENPTRRNLEYVLLQLNDLPGLSASANLAPGSETGTARLAVSLVETRLTAEGGFSNHGTRYIGPNRFEASAAANNILSPGGDTLAFNILHSPNFSDLSLVTGSYALPLNSYGLSLEVGGFAGVTRPKWTLETLDINSRSSGANITLSQNILRSRPVSWDVYGMFDWQDADSTSLGQQLSADHIRALRVGTTLAGTDDWRGYTTSKLEVSHGLDVFSASGQGNNQTSRLRGHGEGFTKAKIDLSRLQNLNSYWNLLLAGSGQFSTHALLAGEEFGLGGETFGRGFDTNDLSGEQGLATRAELQATFHPDEPWLQSWQLFGFYDYGMVWNKDRDPLETNQAQTLSSAGYGARLNFTDSFSGEFMVAKPMTHRTASTGTKDPSFLFRLKGRFATGDNPAAPKPETPKAEAETIPTGNGGNS
jgi:hemolysin activation/secretion protein